MDDPAVDPRQLAVSLRFIRRVNRWLGGTRAVMWHLREWSAGWRAGEVISIVDVATGSADIPLAIVGEFGERVRVVGVDIHETTLALAREHVKGNAKRGTRNGKEASIGLVRASAFALPVGDGAVDYAITSMFMHHLTETEVIAVIREMLRVARRGIIVNDLLRSRFARAGVHAMTLLADPIDKHDARVSVEKAWTREEVERWPAEVGAEWLQYRYHFPSRFTLAGERPGG